MAKQLWQPNKATLHFWTSHSFGANIEFRPYDLSVPVLSLCPCAHTLDCTFLFLSLPTPFSLFTSLSFPFAIPFCFPASSSPFALVHHPIPPRVTIYPFLTLFPFPPPFHCRKERILPSFLPSQSPHPSTPLLLLSLVAPERNCHLSTRTTIPHRPLLHQFHVTETSL